MIFYNLIFEFEKHFDSIWTNKKESNIHKRAKHWFIVFPVDPSYIDTEVEHFLERVEKLDSDVFCDIHLVRYYIKENFKLCYVIYFEIVNDYWFTVIQTLEYRGIDVNARRYIDHNPSRRDINTYNRLYRKQRKL